MRLDVYLAESGLAESRSRAKALIGEGAVLVNGVPVRKPSFETDGSGVRLIPGTFPYVSRGALKLKGAAEAFGTDFSGLTVCDIGASCGGFTDYMLSRGVSKVFAVDSGRDQLHEKLRRDPRVVSLERFNAKELSKDILGCLCDAATADLSFISQTKVYPAVASILKDGAFFISLIKPQFEAGREYVGRGGIVRDRNVHIRVINDIIAAAEKNRLYARGLTVSPITGGDGNVEYLAIFAYNDGGSVTVGERDAIRAVRGDTSNT